MKQRLHIHCGIHRTGTTSIHKNLYNNRVRLQKCGIYYPEMGVEYRHVKLAWQLISKKMSPPQMLEHLQDEIPKNAVLTILSSEDFSQMKNMDWLGALAHVYDLSVSVYLKRQDAWLESWYNQHIKWPWDKRLSQVTPEVFLQHLDEFYWIDFDILLEKIVAVVAREKLYVNVIDTSGIRDTVADFLRYCEIDTKSLKLDKMRNESITTAQLDIIRRINLFDIKPAGRHKLLTALRKLHILEDDGSKIVFDDQQIHFILDKFQSSNQKVAKNYFGRDELFLDPVKWNRHLHLVSDQQAYQVYIPQLLHAVLNAPIKGVGVTQLNGNCLI